MSHDGAALNVVTPERVAMSLPLAGIGSRTLAYAIDSAILFAGFLAIYFTYSLVGPSVIELVESLSTLLRVLSAFLIFTVLWGYWTLSELKWNGQSPGKRVLNIRVVRTDGSPITFFESAVRNLVRAIDFMPILYLTGLTVMLIDRKNRRLGDLVAGTVLIREEAVDLSHYQRLHSAAPHLDTRHAELINTFLSRYDTLQESARKALAGQLLTQVAPELNAEQRQAVMENAQTMKAYFEQRLAGSSRG